MGFLERVRFFEISKRGVSSKIQGLEKHQKINKRGDVYLAPERNYLTGTSDIAVLSLMTMTSLTIYGSCLQLMALEPHVALLMTASASLSCRQILVDISSKLRNQ